MITAQELRPSPLPENQDRIVAARTSSAICLIAAVWFFVSPFAFSGVSEQHNAWNAWLIGALIFVVSCARMVNPLHSTPLCWVNAILGAWILISPWVFDYTANSPRFMNSLAVGAVIAGFALFSASSTHHGTRPANF